MIETLNSDCYCVSLDKEALRRALEADRAAGGLHAMIEERCPNLFASLPVFVAREHVDQMAAVIRAAEEVIALPAYREAALAWAPAIARHDPGAVGAFIGYDFHLGPQGPRLIEINTNAGGALLNAVLARAQRACCAEIEALVSGPVPAASLERTLFEMFVSEWRRSGRTGLPKRIAIIDDAPSEQFMYPEFLLFAQLFRGFGVEAAVLAPEQLAFENGVLRDAQGQVDLVYNRLTDFAFEAPAHAALRDAYLADGAVITPHPRAHALYADKRNLSLLSDEAQLRAWGVDPAVLATLLQHVPRTRIVTEVDAERLWAERRRLFFKPAAGHGSRAAYRGEKLTRRVWSEILAGTYVAQDLVLPSERRIGPEASLKVDVRNYVYDGEVQLLAARLYQGQTTNMRTAGGGFAPVLTTPSFAADREPPRAPRTAQRSPVAA
ncbi:MAG TPA: hypothetical protein VFP62_08600 [Burkholderiales bacterium]|jgi:hypothetical protein|nr:hypothetical protein [Burkholderiales bacterium]